MSTAPLTWQNHLLRGGRSLLNLILAAWLGYLVVQVSLSGGQPMQPVVAATRPTVAPAANSATSQMRLDIAPVVNAHLFGQVQRPPPKPVNPAPLPSELPETRLNLTLYGIYHSSMLEASYVMIGAAKQSAQRYQQGDELSKGVVLHDIQTKNVVLARGGRYETLSLRKPLPNTAAASRTATTNVSPTAQSATNPSQLLKTYQQELKTNPRNLLKLARISPVNRDGKLIGYRLRPGRDPTLLSQFDLRSGDILTAVNGVMLDSPLKGLGVVQQLADANQLELQVLRNGQQMQFSFVIEN